MGWMVPDPHPPASCEQGFRWRQREDDRPRDRPCGLEGQCGGPACRALTHELLPTVGMAEGCSEGWAWAGNLAQCLAGDARLLDSGEQQPRGRTQACMGSAERG